jgi:pimeloyl-ACP methyl ester carboxylesterase
MSPVAIHYREFGHGRPLVFLHRRFRILIPDRSGYGHSSRVSGEMPLDFQRRAALETFSFLDTLGVESAILWGHSDGAVIAAMMGLIAPERCASLILEAFHFFRRKPGSRSFFERFAAHPEDLGDETRKLLAEDHGEANWQTVLRRNCAAWFRIADSVQRPDEDLYDGKLGGLQVPVLFLHGSLDPRTEPGEMDRVRQALPRATMRFIATGQHSPHSEEDAWQECNASAREFVLSNA